MDIRKKRWLPFVTTTEKRREEREEEEEFSREVIAYNSNMEKSNKKLYNAFKSYYNPSSFRTYSVLILYHSLDRLETMRDEKKFKELKEHLEQAIRDIETLINTSGIDELNDEQHVDVIIKQIVALNEETAPFPKMKEYINELRARNAAAAAHVAAFAELPLDMGGGKRKKKQKKTRHKKTKRKKTRHKKTRHKKTRHNK